MHIFGRVAYCCNSLRLLKLIGVFVKYYHFAPGNCRRVDTYYSFLNCVRSVFCC